MTNNYDTRKFNYSEQSALQQLHDIVSNVAIEENERIIRGEHVDYCESFAIIVGGTQIAFELNAPQCCALDAFIETFASECGYTIER